MGLVSSKLSARSIWVCSLSAGTVAIAAYYVYKKTAFSDDTVDSSDVNMAKRISGGYSDWQYAALGIPPPKRNNNYVIASTSTSTAQSPCSSLSSQSLGTGTSQVSSNYCPVYPTSRSIGNSEYNLAYDIEAAMKLEGVSLIDTHCHWDFIFGRIFLLQQERFTIKEFIRRYNHLFPMSYSGCIAVFCEPAKWLRVRHILNLSFLKKIVKFKKSPRKYFPSSFPSKIKLTSKNILFPFPIFFWENTQCAVDLL